MRLHPDFADLLKLLNEAGAEYLIVGGYAVISHGYIRTTGDIDVFVRASPANAAKVMRAMNQFGRPPGLSEAVLSQVAGSPPTGFRFGRPPLAVDLLTSIQGVTFDDAWANNVVRQFDGLEVHVIGIQELLRSKRATGRPKDGVDADELERLLLAGETD